MRSLVRGAVWPLHHVDPVRDEEDGEERSSARQQNRERMGGGGRRRKRVGRRPRASDGCLGRSRDEEPPRHLQDRE